MKLTFENNLRNCLRHLVVNQIVYKRHRIFPFFYLLVEPNAACYFYAYNNGTTRTRQLLNYDPLQITVNARLFGRSVLGRSTGRLEPEMSLKFQVVLSFVWSAPGRPKTGTCQRCLSAHSHCKPSRAELNLTGPN